MGAAPMDAEDLGVELDKMDQAQQGKATEVDQAKVEAEVAALLALAAQGRRQEAIDGLLAVEKAGRTAEDSASTRLACTSILQVLFDAGDWKGVEEHILLLSKRRSQLKQAVQAMVRQAMGFVAAAPDTATKDQLLTTLQTLTEGKIYVEIERARVTRQLAAMREAEGKVAEAAELLQEVPVETFGAMAKTERIAYILEQVRLCLEREDYVRAQILSNKVSPRAFVPKPDRKGDAAGEIGIEGTAIEEPEEGTPSLEALKLRYYELMVRYHSHEGAHLEICRAYRAVLDTPEVAADEGRALEVLRKVAFFAVLAPRDSDQATLLALTAADARLDGLPAFKDLLTKFSGKEVLWWKVIEKEMGPHMDALADVFGGDAGAKRRSDLRLRVIEHNLAVVSGYYTRITTARLAQILDLTPAEAEQHLSDMVVSGALAAKVDRPAGVVRFGAARGPGAALNAWSGNIGRLLVLVEKTCQQIQKESQVHKVPIGAA